MKTPDFWHKLDAIDLPAAPLPAQEMDRLRARVQAAMDSDAPAPAAVRPPRRLWLRTAVAAAVCLVVLGATNAAAPALAESLPVVGGVFAWLNSRDKAQLKGQNLDEAAVPADRPAATAPADPGADAGPAVTLRQIYCDGLYLRLALTLEDTDGSLAGIDQVMTEHRVLEQPDELTDAALCIDGAPAAVPFTRPLFTRVDDTTFAAELIYPLPTELSGTHTGSVTLFTLGVDGRWGAEGYTQDDLPGGDRTLTFTFTADTADNRGWTGPAEQNGYVLESVTATPGETCVVLRLPEGADDPAVQLTAGNTAAELAGSRAAGDDSWRYDFDAVAADATSLTVTLTDKNRDGATLAVFTVEIAQETGPDF